MPWIEITNQPTLTYSNEEGFIGTRVFMIWGGVDRSTLATDPESVDNGLGINLPAYDSAWPYGSIDQTIVPTLVKYIASQDGDTITATAVYSDDRTRANYSANFQTESEEIPVFNKVSYVTGGTGPTFAWSPSSVNRFSTWMRVGFRVFYKYDGNDPLYELNGLILPHTNKLCNFGGGDRGPLWLRFEGGEINQITFDRYTINYSWVYETGVQFDQNSLHSVPTPIGNMVRASDVFVYPSATSQLYGEGAGVFFRPPFERIRAIPYIGVYDTTDPPQPKFSSVLDFYKDGIDGMDWRLMPGLGA